MDVRQHFLQLLAVCSCVYGRDTVFRLVAGVAGQLQQVAMPFWSRAVELEMCDAVVCSGQKRVPPPYVFHMT